MFVCLICVMMRPCIGTHRKRDWWNLIRGERRCSFSLYSKQCDIKKLNGSFLNILPAFNDHGNLLYMKKLIRCCVNIPFDILVYGNGDEVGTRRLIVRPKYLKIWQLSRNLFVQTSKLAVNVTAVKKNIPYTLKRQFSCSSAIS